MVLKMSANCSTLQMIEAWHLHVSVSACVKRDSERNWFQAFFLDAAGHCGEQFQDRTVDMIRSSAL